MVEIDITDLTQEKRYYYGNGPLAQLSIVYKVRLLREMEGWLNSYGIEIRKPGNKWLSKIIFYNDEDALAFKIRFGL